MKRVVTFALVAIAAAAFAACSKKNSGNSAATVPVTPVNPNYLVGSCAPGQIFNSSYGCLDRGLCESGYGYVPSTQRCEQGTQVTFDQAYGGQATLRFSGYGMRITSKSVFKTMLRDYGICDRAGYSWFQWTGGSFQNLDDCDYYSNQSYIMLNALGASSSNVSMDIGAGSAQPYSVYDLWLPYGASGQKPVVLNFRGVYYPIDNAGFEIRSQSLYSNSYNQVPDQGLKVYAASGRLTDNNIPVQIYYKGSRMGTATLTRY